MRRGCWPHERRYAVTAGEEEYHHSAFPLEELPDEQVTTLARIAGAAFERGDVFYQCAIDFVWFEKATEIVNAICGEGWELITGSVVFEQQYQRGDLSITGDVGHTGEQDFTTVRTTRGYYMFRRQQPNRRAAPEDDGPPVGIVFDDIGTDPDQVL